MDNRGPKKTDPMETILFEIDMLRHCRDTRARKKEAFDMSRLPSDRYEYYLCIEGFLLHLRNLLAFFTDQHNKLGDLTMGRPTVWARREVAERHRVDLIERAKADGYRS